MVMVCIRKGCGMKWSEAGRWPRVCPYCGSDRIMPVREGTGAS